MAYTAQADIDILAYADYGVNDDVENLDLNDMLDAFQALADNVVAIIGADATPDDNINDMVADIAAVLPAIIPEIHRTVISNGADTDHDLDFTAGDENDSTGAYKLGGDALTKRFDAAWAAGTGNGGLFAGALANSTWYSIWKIRKDADGSIDIGADTYANAVTNLPAGYSVYRRIGYFLTNGSANLYQFIQRGNEFHWTGTPPAYYTLANPGVNQVTPAVACPPSEIAIVNVGAAEGGDTIRRVLFGNTSITVAPGATNLTCYVKSSTAIHSHAEARIPVNASSQIGYEADGSDANLSVFIYNVGFIATGI